MSYKKIEEIPTQVFTPLNKSQSKIPLKFKFTIAVIISLTIVMGLGVWNLNRIQIQTFEQEARHRTELVLNFGKASRNYVIEELLPVVEKDIKEKIVAGQSHVFATRKILDIFNQQLPEYIYKQPVLNAINQANQADEFESGIISYFQNYKTIQEKSGYVKKQDTELFYLAQPIKIETNCLKCHGKLENVAESIPDKYGVNSGFDWQLGDIVSAMIIYVPTQYLHLTANSAAMIEAVLFTFIVLTIVLIIVIYLLFDKLVGKRIYQVSQAMNQAAAHPGVTVRINDQGKDELGRMAKIFNRMANSLDRAYNHLEEKVAARTAEIEQTLQELQITQGQLIQAEKMSSLGQLVAGIAHEINNPLSFISGNINHAQMYSQDLLELVAMFQETYPQTDSHIQKYMQTIDLEFVKEDLPSLLNSMKIGSDRINQIVVNLRNFSRLDQAEMQFINLHEGIDSTLVILQHRLKANPNHPEILIIKEYADLPLVESNAGQISQVFMNVLTNAIDALIYACENDTNKNGTATTFTPQIMIKTEIVNSQSVMVTISDNGGGMTEEVSSQIFNPFFTTKPIGKGTGLGLSISYKIIVERHQGSICCQSELGKGTSFDIQIPVTQAG